MRYALLALAVVAGLLGVVPVPSASASSYIGYVYVGGTQFDIHAHAFGAIDVYGMNSDYTLSPVGTTTLPVPYGVNLFLVHTPGGISVYATASPDGSTYNAYEYSVDQITGALVDKGVSLTNTQLYAEHDGYGMNGTGSDYLYSDACSDNTCANDQYEKLDVDPTDGTLSVDACCTVVESPSNVPLIANGRDVRIVFNDTSHTNDVYTGTIDGNGDPNFGLPVTPNNCNGQPEGVGGPVMAGPNVIAATATNGCDNADQPSRVVQVFGATTQLDAAVANEADPGATVFGVSTNDIVLVGGQDSSTQTGFLEPLYNDYPGGTAVGLPTLEYPTHVAFVGNGVYATLNGGHIFQGTDGVNGVGLTPAATPTIADGSSQPSLVGTLVTPPTTATLNVTSTGGGTVTSDPTGIDCGTTCSADYTLATPVTLTEIPDTGKRFVGWSGDCSGTTTTCDLTMDDNRTATATFEDIINKPDALVKSMKDVAFVGDGTYNTDGSQSTLLKIKRTKTGLFTIEAQNDGNVDDVLSLTGCASSRGFGVKWFDGATDITSQVEGVGGFSTGTLSPGGSKDITLRIHVALHAKGTKTCDLLATSTNDTTKQDLVRSIVRVRL